MNLIEDIVSQGHGGLDADYIVIHETSNPGATARNHRDLWSRDDTYAVHYVGDWSGDVYHCVPDDRLCWQVGNGNGHVIGIELCHAENQADFDAVWKVGVEWARMMLDAHGWDTSHLISHDICRQWWGGTDHTDPVGYFSDYGKTWDDFVAAVATGGSSSMGLGTGQINVWPDYGSMWRVTKEKGDEAYPGGLYSFRNCITGQALQVNQPIGSGTGIAMADYDPSRGDQLFSLAWSEQGDNGLARECKILSAMNGNFCLMNNGSGGVDTWNANDGDNNQLWAMTIAESGCFRVVNFNGAALRI